ncbi:hypothetical protein EB796_020317 [Bugula neritina]|uniref:Uncharacterized protein n=1 Tax=Bugula neritina TaxID=10212 RepID=A0A7J7J6U0_BUGNE|nr:hypothetical protein EB796_020317 [Bugula neritina]
MESRQQYHQLVRAEKSLTDQQLSIATYYIPKLLRYPCHWIRNPFNPRTAFCLQILVDKALWRLEGHNGDRAVKPGSSQLPTSTIGSESLSVAHLLDWTGEIDCPAHLNLRKGLENVYQTWSVQPQSGWNTESRWFTFMRLLQQPAVRQNLETKITKKLKDLPEDPNVDINWTCLKGSLTETCKAVLGNLKRLHQDWFDENDHVIEQLLAQKRVKCSAWQDDFRNKDKKQAYHAVRADVQRLIWKMQNHWWTKKAVELQSLADQNKTREFFAETRKLYGPTSRGSAPVKDKDGTPPTICAGVCVENKRKLRIGVAKHM